MDAKKATKFRQEIERLRRAGGVRSSDLISLAERLGRKPYNRGKEPTWVKPGRFPLSIPNHPGDMKRGTVNSILKVLESDLESIEVSDESEPESE